jgi:4-hydroxyphenylpyruvate dioxygenase
MRMTGWHEFAEFTAADVGTLNSGLNSIVVASNNEFVLLPLNEPTHGTPRKSQIQTYLEQNRGPGLQHIAILTSDIFSTMRELKSRSYVGGFEFMPTPAHSYYERVPERIGADTLTPEQLAELESLGLLADKDDQGVLLQVFTKPLGDRPTIFIEIIQRIGCTTDECGQPIEQKGGCGGFGKGNFSELFKSIEEYEKQLQEAAEKSGKAA